MHLNTATHRAKMRCWQIILLLQDVVQAHDPTAFAELPVFWKHLFVDEKRISLRQVAAWSMLKTIHLEIAAHLAAMPADPLNSPAAAKACPTLAWLLTELAKVDLRPAYVCSLLDSGIKLGRYLLATYPTPVVLGLVGDMQSMAFAHSINPNVTSRLHGASVFADLSDLMLPFKPDGHDALAKAALNYLTNNPDAARHTAALREVFLYGSFDFQREFCLEVSCICSLEGLADHWLTLAIAVSFSSRPASLWNGH